jgi:hypothetical protein
VAVPKWEGTRIRIEVRKKNASKQKIIFYYKKKYLPGVHKIREVERCLSERCRSGSLQREGKKHLKGKKKKILQIFVSFIIIMIVSITFTTILGFLKTV